ncbi:MAG: two pore domain potassium channel family protein [Bacteroidales bacterium]|nr:two pore domain potassium channel family protein [Bacteroidales bacterium]
MINLLKIFHEKSQSNLVTANSLLLGIVFVLLVLVAFFPAGIQDTLNKILITATFFCSIYALAYRSRVLLPIAILMTLLQWTAKIIGNDILELVAGSVNMIFFIYIVVKLVRQFASAKTVSPLVILGSVNGYLLLGLVFSLFTILVSSLYPQSYFSFHENIYLTDKVDFHTYIYYTFITMATVGYGDLVPISSPARALAVFVSVCGQLYIAIVIAFLVGKFAGAYVKVNKRTGGQTD